MQESIAGPFISSDNHIAVMAALFSIAAVGLLAEKMRIGAQLTGAVVVIITAILAANIDLIPHQEPAYDFVFTYFVPILIPLFLFKANLRRIFFEITRTAMAFLLACVGAISGVLIGIWLLAQRSILRCGNRRLQGCLPRLTSVGR